MLIDSPTPTDPIELALRLVNCPSVSGNEKALADEVEKSLAVHAPWLHLVRLGDAIVARTELGRGSRVVIAGHLDTVPIAGNVPGRREMRDGQEVIWGRGSVDMKAGVAVQLALATAVSQPARDVTWVFYDHEEVEDALNGLGRIARTAPELLAADFAVLCEPTAGLIEGGCNGTMRVVARTRGVAAHSARAWRGVNAVHAAAPILARLAAYEPATVQVEGLDFRESLGAVMVKGGVATNVIPDLCEVTINYRFAPSTTTDEAFAHIAQVLAGLEVELEVRDMAPGARPGLDVPAAATFAAAVQAVTGAPPGPKYGWTDVARFSQLGIPAVNFGPGDPNLAHTDDEHCPVDQITSCYQALESFLTSA